MTERSESALSSAKRISIYNYLLTCLITFLPKVLWPSVVGRVLICLLWPHLVFLKLVLMTSTRSVTLQGLQALLLVLIHPLHRLESEPLTQFLLLIYYRLHHFPFAWLPRSHTCDAPSAVIRLAGLPGDQLIGMSQSFRRM